MADGSLSQFKATLARKKARKAKTEGKFDRKKLGFNSGSGQEMNFPKPSESELLKIKKQIQKKAKNDQRKELFLIGILAIAVLVLLVYINQ